MTHFMKKNAFRKIAVTLTCATILFTLTACGKKTEKEDDASEKGVTTITVATGNASLPFCYLNEDSKFDGLDVKLMEAIDKALPEYKFKFIGGDFPTTLSNLESGKAMIASFQFEVNNERKAKFTYGTVPYTDWDTFIVTDGDKGKALNTFDEAKGKKIYVTTGTNQAAMAENYLKEHKDAFTLVYGEYTNEQIVEAIKSGTVDATLAPKYSNDLFIKNYGVNFVIGNQPVNQSKAFILFNKKADAKLQKAVNDEMEKLKSDGTLLKLSKKYLGGDYVPKN